MKGQYNQSSSAIDYSQSSKKSHSSNQSNIQTSKNTKLENAGVHSTTPQQISSELGSVARATQSTIQSMNSSQIATSTATQSVQSTSSTPTPSSPTPGVHTSNSTPTPSSPTQGMHTSSSTPTPSSPTPGVYTSNSSSTMSTPTPGVYTSSVQTPSQNLGTNVGQGIQTARSTSFQGSSIHSTTPQQISSELGSVARATQSTIQSMNSSQIVTSTATQSVQSPSSVATMRASTPGVHTTSSTPTTSSPTPGVHTSNSSSTMSTPTPGVYTSSAQIPSQNLGTNVGQGIQTARSTSFQGSSIHSTTPQQISSELGSVARATQSTIQSMNSSQIATSTATQSVQSPSSVATMRASTPGVHTLNSTPTMSSPTPGVHTSSSTSTTSSPTRGGYTSNSMPTTSSPTPGVYTSNSTPTMSSPTPGVHTSNSSSTMSTPTPGVYTSSAQIPSQNLGTNVGQGIQTARSTSFQGSSIHSTTPQQISSELGSVARATQSTIQSMNSSQIATSTATQSVQSSASTATMSAYTQGVHTSSSTPTTSSPTPGVHTSNSSSTMSTPTPGVYTSSVQTPSQNLGTNVGQGIQTARSTSFQASSIHSTTPQRLVSELAPAARPMQGGIQGEMSRINVGKLESTGLLNRVVTGYEGELRKGNSLANDTAVAGIELVKGTAVGVKTVAANPIRQETTALQDIKGEVKKIAGDGLSKFKSELAKDNSLSNAAVLGTINSVTGTIATVKGVNVALSNAHTIVKGTVVAANGAYQVVTDAGRITMAAYKTYNTAVGLKMSVDKQLVSLFKANALNAGIGKTVVSQRIIHTVNDIKTGIKNTVHTAVAVKDASVRMVNTGKCFAKGVRNGTLSVGYVAGVSAVKAEQMLLKGVTKAMPHALTGAKIVGRGVMNAGIKTARLADVGARGISTKLSNSDDLGLAAVGNSMKFGIRTMDLAKTGIKTGKAIGTGVTNGIKTSVKLGKATVQGVSLWANLVKNNGWKKAMQAVGKGAKKGIKNVLKEAGHSLVNAVIQAAKLLSKKVLIPVGIILFLLLGGISAVMSPIAGIANIFSGIFGTSDTNEEFSVEEFLANSSYGVPYYTAKTKQDLVDQMKNDLVINGGSYHIVRLTCENHEKASVINTDLAGVSKVFYTDAEVIQILTPIFNAVIWSKYEGEPTLKQAKDLLKEMYEKTFTITSVESVPNEVCGQKIADGTGTPFPPHSCGSIHAIKLPAVDACPNMITGYHTSYTCSSCDHKKCPGHSGHHSSSCPKGCTSSHTWYCSGCQFDYCSGYAYCGSHKVNTYTITLDGLYPLIEKYFEKPINDLKNKASLTEDEQLELQNLEDWYEIFQEMMKQIVGSGSYGSGLTEEELSKVSWNPTTRTGNEDVINLAISQLGNVGGATYWSYYGFSSRVEWCACFVHWCMRNTPSASGSYADTANNAYCQTVANYYKGTGQFRDSSSYADLTKGDLIFFDWQSDGHTDHIGLVIGTDDKYVYTVEGNSGDMVKIKKYLLNSASIYGYVYLNY